MNKNNFITRPADQKIPLSALLATLRVSEDDDEIETIERMRKEALDAARPLSLYAPFQPDISGGIITLNGIRFSEPFVYEKLSDQKTVVIYVASCGAEADAWANSHKGFFEQFVAESMKQLILGKAMEHLFKETAKFFDPEKNVSTINPGSLEMWPITSQIPLFEALGDVAGEIGVTLTESCLMIPNKSVSGIMFETAEHYANCQLCPREKCEGRRAEYQPMWA